MIRSVVSSILVATSLLVGSLIAGGCDGGTEDGQGSEQSGMLSMPLITAAGDHIYRVNASLDIYGPIYTTLYTTDDPNETSLSATLPTGDYTAYLSSWSLERDDGNGNFVPVSSYLVSDYYVGFTIHNQATTTISFQFETDGVIVTVGSGTLRVNFGVNEIPQACTVFGDDCYEGTWCAPPELTGNPLACVPEGYVPVGDPCSSPTDCVANASCFDFGEGPACGGLCAQDDFGAACSSGGTCVPAGIEYGVCVPEGGTLPNGGVGTGSGGGTGTGGGGISTGGAKPY